MMNASIRSGVTDIDSSRHHQKMIGRFTIGPEIGRGSFANVYKGYDTTTNKPVAIKSVVRSRLKNKKLIENLEIEIQILKKLKNPHIVSLIDCIQTSKHFHLFMEYCSLGDLSYFIKNRDQLSQTHPIISVILQRYPSEPGSQGLNHVLVVNFLKQLSSALKFLRSQNLIHRDIKPQNLLLSPPIHSQTEFIENGYNGLFELPILKIADFGFARFLPSQSMAETLCGSPLYMAPEILRYEKYNAKADLWSVGAVIYEMAVGKPPFKASSPMELLKNIERGKDNIPFPSAAKLSNDLIRLICGLLKLNPTQRMGFQEFFNDPLILNPIDECINKPLDCGDQVDEQLFISEYLPNKNKRFGTTSGDFDDDFDDLDEVEDYKITTNANNPPDTHGHARAKSKTKNTNDTIIEEVEENSTRQQQESKNVTPPIRRKKSESPSDSLLYTIASDTENKISNPVRIPTPMESSDNDEAIKTLITRNSPGAASSKVKPGSNVDSPKLKKRSKNQNDVVFEKDYVVVEKRTVEVNALADELANIGINSSNTGKQGHNSTTTNTNNNSNNNTNNNRASSPVSRNSSLIRRYSASNRLSSTTSARRQSFGDRKMPISISPTNALTKALGYTSNRLFANSNATLAAAAAQQQQLQQQQLQLQQQQLQQQQQQQQNSIDSATSHLNQNLLTPSSSAPLKPINSSNEKISSEESQLIQQLENLSTMAHAISLFAEVKFSQLIPLPPSLTSNIADSDTNSDISNNLPPPMIKHIAEEGVVLYVKTLSLLAKAMKLASNWWYNNNQNLKTSTSVELNELVQWIRSRFNESLEKAEFLKLRLAESKELINSLNNSQSSASQVDPGADDDDTMPVAEKLIFDRSLEMSRTAALNELKNEDLIGCELCYSTAIWMLESLLTTGVSSGTGSDDNDEKDKETNKLDADDRKTVELFINSIGNRLHILRIKIEKQQQMLLTSAN